MKNIHIRTITYIIVIVVFFILMFKIHQLNDKMNKIGVLLTQTLIKNVPSQNQEILISENNDFSIGDPYAPVTVIMFSDYECGYCKSFFEEVFPLIKEELISTGFVRFIIKDYPIDSHENAFYYAQMAKCAYRQGKFLEMHEILNANQGKINEKKYLKWADQINMNIDSAKICLSSQDIVSEIHQDIKDAKNAGIRGTPAFVINNKLYLGTRPYNQFKDIIIEQVEAYEANENACQ